MDFEQEWQAALKFMLGGHGDRRPVPAIRALDGGLGLAVGSVADRNAAGPIFFGLAVATREGTNQPFVMAGNNARCESAFSAFVARVKPHGSVAPMPNAATPRPQPDQRIAGLWIGMNTVSSVGMIGGGPIAPQYIYQTGAARWSMVLLPDGRYVREPPDGGIDEATLGRVTLGQRGTYRFGGTTVLLTDGRGEVERMDYRDGKLSNASGSLDVRSTFINRTPLSGRYSAQPDPARWRVERFNSEPTISFEEGGRFVDAGALHWLRRDALTRMPGSGRCAVDDCNITFTYDDGRQLRMAAFVAGRNGLKATLIKFGPGTLAALANA